MDTNGTAFHQVDDDLFISPQLTPEQMPGLYAAGFRTIINNRPDAEGGSTQPTSAQLEAAARAAGLEYRHLPVPPSGYTQDDGRAMVALVDAAPKPVLGFCRSGKRAAGLYQLGRAAA